MVTKKQHVFAATTETSSTYVFESPDPPGMLADSPEAYIDWLHFDINTNDEDVSDDELNEIYAGEIDAMVPFANVTGYLLKCEEMLNNGLDPYETCDEVSADLGYTISALQEPNAPLNEDEGNEWYSVFYINEIELHDDADVSLLPRVMEELPFIIRQFSNIRPEILAYFPSPTRNDWETPEQKDRDLAMSKIISERIEKSLMGYGGYKPEAAKDEASSEGNVSTLPVEYQLDADDLRRYRGERVPGSVGYPSELKDKKLIKQYTDCGFIEAGESRLLYKVTIE